MSSGICSTRLSCTRDGDGIGDQQGVLEKLDYLNDGDDTTDMDLGINGIWLMPVMPSVTYHKNDTTDYENIDPQYGTLETFEIKIASRQENEGHILLSRHSFQRETQFPIFLAVREGKYLCSSIGKPKLDRILL